MQMELLYALILYSNKINERSFDCLFKKKKGVWRVGKKGGKILQWVSPYNGNSIFNTWRSDDYQLSACINGNVSISAGEGRGEYSKQQNVRVCKAYLGGRTCRV